MVHLLQKTGPDNSVSGGDVKTEVLHAIYVASYIWKQSKGFKISITLIGHRENKLKQLIQITLGTYFRVRLVMKPK